MKVFCSGFPNLKQNHLFFFLAIFRSCGILVWFPKGQLAVFRGHPSIDPSESDILRTSDLGLPPVLPSKVIVERSRFKPVTKMHTEVMEVRGRSGVSESLTRSLCLWAVWMDGYGLLVKGKKTKPPLKI